MATNEEIIEELRATRTELRGELKELRTEMKGGFEAQNGRIRKVEARQAEYGVRIGACETRQAEAPDAAPAGGNGAAKLDVLAILQFLLPWTIKLMVAGAFIAWGVNAPATVEALAAFFK